jgi:NAD(P)-dependent dehydrogenase (short-subunit alcohol dehydrogenase family)
MRLQGNPALSLGAHQASAGRPACSSQEGARVAIGDKNRSAAEKVASECRKTSAEAIAVEADVSRTADVKRMVEAALRAFQRLDVLVNNAGYGIAGTVVETEDQAWDDLMAVNLRGVFLCCKHAIPAMTAQGGGTIVNVASIVAAVGIRSRAAYVTSKGGFAALTRAIALDHVSDKIRCNAIAPGTIETPYTTRSSRTAPTPRDCARASRRGSQWDGSAPRRRSPLASCSSRARTAGLPPARC